MMKLITYVKPCCWLLPYRSTCVQTKAEHFQLDSERDASWHELAWFDSCPWLPPTSQLGITTKLLRLAFQSLGWALRQHLMLLALCNIICDLLIISRIFFLGLFPQLAPPWQFILLTYETLVTKPTAPILTGTLSFSYIFIKLLTCLEYYWSTPWSSRYTAASLYVLNFNWRINWSSPSDGHLQHQLLHTSIYSPVCTSTTLQQRQECLQTHLLQQTFASTPPFVVESSPPNKKLHYTFPNFSDFSSLNALHLTTPPAILLLLHHLCSFGHPTYLPLLFQLVDNFNWSARR